MFAAYVMVDWTGGNSRRIRKADAIWIAFGNHHAAAPTIVNPASRGEATDAVRAILTPFASGSEPGRVLVCFDFAYGYPRGFGASLPTTSLPGTVPPWQNVWNYLAAAVKDDLGTARNRVRSNKSNRFEVAEAVNRHLSPRGGPFGPFWCLSRPGSQKHVPQNQPKIPFLAESGVSIDSLRRTDRQAESDTPFRLFGNGSVGSQVLTGIPHLSSLRFHPALSAASTVWPFETGWATEPDGWLGDGVKIVHAEIYPSVRKPCADAIKDRGQVRAMWQWARDLDACGDLWRWFSAPADVRAGSACDVAIREEEGWILGAPAPGPRSATTPRAHRERAPCLEGVRSRDLVFRHFAHRQKR